MTHFLPIRFLYWLLAGCWLLALHASGAPPQRLVLPQQLMAGLNSSFYLKADGTLYSWGYNTNGELGDGTSTQRLSPVATQVPAGVRLVQVASGGAHTLGLATTGVAYAWGANDGGQLGTGGSSASRLVPTAVAMPVGIHFTQLTAGDSFSVGLAADGTAYAWGDNSDGELGDGSTISHATPLPVTMPMGVRFTQVVACSYFTLALAADGTAYGWGFNSNGQLGNGTSNTRSLTPTAITMPAGVRFTQLAGGHSHALALADNGSAYAWGDDTFGQVGRGFSAGIGGPAVTTPTLVALPSGVRLVHVASSNSSFSSMGLAADGIAYAWGQNSAGHLGTGGTAYSAATPAAVVVPTGVRLVQLSTGQAHTLGLAAGGQVYGWGSNFYGTLGDGTTTDHRTPTLAAVPSGPLGYVQVAGGAQHSVALRTDGTAWAWGQNVYGALGDNTTVGHVQPTAVALPTGLRLVQVAAGTAHTLALAANGTAYAWGNNQYGQLGDGTTSNRLGPVPLSIPGGASLVQVVAGDYASLALAADGTLYAWGRNVYGQLGDGTTTQQGTPTAVALPAGTRVVEVAAGGAHALARTATGAVYGWGFNDGGQVGTGLAGLGYYATPQLLALPAGVAARQLAAGYSFSMLLAADGTAYAWGAGGAGQLGTGSTASFNPTPAAVAMPAGARFRQLAGGSAHALALADDGHIYSWGNGLLGALGNNAYTSRTLPALENSGLTTWTSLALSPTAQHSLVLGANGGAYSAGYNADGQLGDGTTANSPIFLRNQAPLPTRATAGTPALIAQPLPNPTAGPVVLQLTVAQAGPATLTVFDELGRTSLVLVAQLPAGSSQLSLPGVEALAPGLYLLHLQQGTQQYSTRLVHK